MSAREPVIPLLFAVLLGVCSAARAEPEPDAAPEAVAALLEVAAEGVTRTWLERHVDPGPHGWTAGARDAWLTALARDGRVAKVLASAEVVHAEPTPRGTLVIVDGPPLLAVELDAAEPPRILTIRPTSCAACPARSRWAQDLLAQVRQDGRLGTRLRPDLELDVRDHVAEHRGLRGQRWSAFLDAYLSSDETVAAALAGAIVRRVEGETVHVRYADGRDDTWHVRPDERLGWRLVYADLAPTSPLRLDGADARRWRRTSTAKDARVQSWADSAATTVGSDGGRRLARGVVGAGLDPVDDTLLVVTLDVDRSLAAAFRVDPVDGGVVDRLELPTWSARVYVDGTPWHARWPVAVHGTRVAVGVPGGVRVADLARASSDLVGRWSADVTALAWTPDGSLVVGLADGRVLVDGTTEHDLVPPEPVVAVHAGGADSSRVEAVLARGDLVAPDGTRSPSGCDAVRDAARTPADGRWYLACATGRRVGWSQAMAPAEDTPTPAHGGAAWSAAGDLRASAAPDGGVLVERLHAPHDRFVIGRTVPHQLGFDGDGTHVWAVDVRGDLWWWDLDTAPRREAPP